MSLYGRRRGYVTVGTAPIAAPWLAFMISDWLVRTAIALKSRRDRLGGMMDAATRKSVHATRKSAQMWLQVVVRGLWSFIQQLPAKLGRLITSRATVLQSIALLVIGLLIPVLGTVVAINLSSVAIG